LPKAESLAATDVALAKKTEAALPAEPAPTVEQPAAKEKKPLIRRRNRHRTDKNRDQPHPAEQPQAADQHQDAPEAVKDNQSKSDQPVATQGPERVKEPAKPEPKPAEPAEPAPLTGQVIMPTAAPKTDEAPKPKLEQPKKLAKGEVFVDEAGNVIIGE
jgi:hypothetical protein